MTWWKLPWVQTKSTSTDDWWVMNMWCYLYILSQFSVLLDPQEVWTCPRIFLGMALGPLTSFSNQNASIFVFFFFSKWFLRHFRWTLDLSHLRKEDANLHGPFSAGSESRQIPAGICRIWNVGTKVYFQSWRDISRVAGGLAISKKSKRSICESVCTKRRCQKVASCGTITYQIPKDTFEDDDFPNFPLVIWWFPSRICFTKHAPQKIDGTKSQFEMGWYFTRRFVG